MTTDKVKLTIRMPDELKEKLEQLSFDAPDASLNAKVVFILEQYFKDNSKEEYPGGVSKKILGHSVKIDDSLSEDEWILE